MFLFALFYSCLIPLLIGNALFLWHPSTITGLEAVEAGVAIYLTLSLLAVGYNEYRNHSSYRWEQLWGNDTCLDQFHRVVYALFRPIYGLLWVCYSLPQIKRGLGDALSDMVSIAGDLTWALLTLIAWLLRIIPNVLSKYWAGRTICRGQSPPV